MKTFEVTEKEFAVIAWDLNRASEYLALLEAAKASPQSTASNNEALSLAAVIAYRRPFTPCDRHNPRCEKKRTPWVPNGLIANLKDEHQDLHEWMRTLRDRTWAHTDEEEFKERLIQSFPKAEILKFKNLIQEVIDRLEINPLLTSSQGKDLTQMEEEYTVNDFFRIIGKISVCFAALDMFTSQLLRDLTKREPSSELPFPVNATLGRKLHLLKDMNPEDTINLDVLTEFKNFLPEALKIADERNRYIHDMWIFDRSLPSGRMRRVQMTYQGIEDGDTVLSIEDLNRF